jgi:hypothetical protein
MSSKRRIVSEQFEEEKIGKDRESSVNRYRYNSEVFLPFTPEIILELFLACFRDLLTHSNTLVQRSGVCQLASIIVHPK